MRVLFTFFVCCFLGQLSAQTDTIRLNLEGIIELAHSDAPDVQIAKTIFSNNYWRFQSFLADYRPQINFDATLPDLNRSIEAITLPDGSDAFINRSLMTNFTGFTISQDIAPTGGNIFATTGLRRLDIFATDGNDAQVSYLSTPFWVGFTQPLFQFNALKWDRKLAPLRYQESQKQYSENMEEIALEAAGLFFDVLIAQLNLQAARRDKANADTLYAISKGRFDVGRIAETELLQIELNVMNADADVAENIVNMQTSTEELRNFLGIQRAVFFDLVPPYEIPEFAVNVEEALQYAFKNRSEMISFSRRLQEARRDVEEAEKNSGVSMDLTLSFGLSKSAGTIGGAYKEIPDNERFRLGLSVPIADWGKARSRREIQVSNEALTQLQVEQDRINFEREILIKVQQFDLVRNQVDIALRAYEVAQKRLSITRKRYLVGNILITDLNLAIREEADARTNYIRTLRNFWLAYYELRRLTLYDFENDRPLIRNVEETGIR